MKSPTRSLLAAGIGLAISTSAFAQPFHITVNPTPITDALSHTVRMSVPNASWLPGSNGKAVADGRLVIVLQNRRTGKKTDFIKTFYMRKDGPTSAFGTFVPNWNTSVFKATSAKMQITIRSNGVNRTISVAVRS